MDQIRTGLEHGVNVVTQAREIGGQYGRGYPVLHRRIVALFYTLPVTRPLTRTAPLRLLLARRAVRALLCLGLALAAPAGAAQEAEQASPEGTAGDASDAAQPAAATPPDTPPAALPRLPPPAPPVPRLPGDAGLLATWLDEPAPGLWQPSQPAQRGVLVVLERSATGARASLALRDSLARSGFASFLALSEAPEVNDLPALLTGLRARAAGTPLVLYVAGDLAARVLPVANELPLDGIVLQDVPGHLGEVAVRAAGQLDASDGPSAASACAAGDYPRHPAAAAAASTLVARAG